MRIDVGNLTNLALAAVLSVTGSLAIVLCGASGREDTGGERFEERVIELPDGRQYTCLFWYSGQNSDDGGMDNCRPTEKEQPK